MDFQKCCMNILQPMPTTEVALKDWVTIIRSGISATGFVLMLGRFLPIIGPVAIAGLLARKNTFLKVAGHIKNRYATFGVMIFAVIVIVRHCLISLHWRWDRLPNIFSMY